MADEVVVTAGVAKRRKTKANGMAIQPAGEEPAGKPDLDYVQTRSEQLAAISRERKRAAEEEERAAAQQQLFPEWPEDRRGAPNSIIRAAVFGVVRKGPRKRVVDMHIEAPEGWEVTLTGWRLDQADCDIYLELMHLARGVKPGEPVRFNLNSMLLAKLGRKGDGGNDRKWLIGRLEGLSQTSCLIKNERFSGGSGSLIGAFQIDKKTGEAIVYTNPQSRPLFDFITYLDINRRRELGGNQLAKALHALISTHADWLPMRCDTLMKRLGASYGELRFFRRDLKAVLTDFERRGWIDGWKITSSDLIHIAIRPSPTQQRLLDRRDQT